MEQRREPMDKNRIRGIRRWTSGQVTAKSVSIKDAGCKFGGCAWTASGQTWFSTASWSLLDMLKHPIGDFYYSSTPRMMPE